MNINFYNDRVTRAEKELADAKWAQNNAVNALARINALLGGLNLPDPTLDPYERDNWDVSVYWDLMATQRIGTAYCCGKVWVALHKSGTIEWTWTSYALRTERTKGAPAFVEDIMPTTVWSHTPPPEFIAFCEKHKELMYSPEDQRKRNTPGILL